MSSSTSSSSVSSSSSSSTPSSVSIAIASSFPSTTSPIPPLLINTRITTTIAKDIKLRITLYDDLSARAAVLRGVRVLKEEEAFWEKRLRKVEKLAERRLLNNERRDKLLASGMVDKEEEEKILEEYEAISKALQGLKKKSFTPAPFENIRSAGNRGGHNTKIITPPLQQRLIQAETASESATSNSLQPILEESGDEVVAEKDSKPRARSVDRSDSVWPPAKKAKVDDGGGSGGSDDGAVDLPTVVTTATATSALHASSVVPTLASTLVSDQSSSANSTLTTTASHGKSLRTVIQPGILPSTRPKPAGVSSVGASKLDALPPKRGASAFFNSQTQIDSSDGFVNTKSKKKTTLRLLKPLPPATTLAVTGTAKDPKQVFSIFNQNKKPASAASGSGSGSASASGSGSKRPLNDGEDGSSGKKVKQ